MVRFADFSLDCAWLNLFAIIPALPEDGFTPD
jgi:Zn-dependent protease